MNKDDIVDALERCTATPKSQCLTGAGCPYALVPGDCAGALMRDALNLLKENVSHKETFSELHDYVKSQLGVVMRNEDDWRPAGGMYIADIVEVINDKYANAPNGIRIWLKNGDSIIYVKKKDDDRHE